MNVVIFHVSLFDAGPNKQLNQWKLDCKNQYSCDRKIWIVSRPPKPLWEGRSKIKMSLRLKNTNGHSSIQDLIKIIDMSSGSDPQSEPWIYVVEARKKRFGKRRQNGDELLNTHNLLAEASSFVAWTAAVLLLVSDSALAIPLVLSKK